MSPEQAGMGATDVDTRADVYALGVLLYEMLVGALPFEPGELKKAGCAAILRRIREDEPPRPSARVSTLGKNSAESARLRQTQPTALRRELQGDLDWIVLKALEKDRARRYDSPNDLAADIERHLTHQPVIAGPPSAAYRAGKFVRRHRWGVTVAAAALIVVIAFAVTMTIQANRIAAERDRAERALTDLESVVEFQAGMLSESDPGRMGQRLFQDLRRRVEELTASAGSRRRSWLRPWSPWTRS